MTIPSNPHTIPPAIREILACPRCHGPLADGPAERPEESATLDCASCAVRFSVRDGIPVLLLDQARSASR